MGNDADSMPTTKMNVQVAQSPHSTLHMEAMEDVRRVETRRLKGGNSKELGKGLEKDS